MKIEFEDSVWLDGYPAKRAVLKDAQGAVVKRGPRGDNDAEALGKLVLLNHGLLVPGLGSHQSVCVDD